MNQRPGHHAMDYVEIAVDDLARARAFYAAAFGWSTTDHGGRYASILGPDGSHETGGLDPSGQPGPGGPFVLLRSPDVDASAQAVTAAGGRVVRGPYAFPGGRRFHFLDTEGNELGVYGD